MKAKTKYDGSTIKNEANTANKIKLETQIPNAMEIEQQQVNGLLALIEPRPDVQDLIRNAMLMDFADDNAKILYIAHLIEQSLNI